MKDLATVLDVTETWSEFEQFISISHSPIDVVEKPMYFYNQLIITPDPFKEKTLHCSEHAVWSCINKKVAETMNHHTVDDMKRLLK